MSDRIAIFSHGRIEQIASPNEIYHRPATRLVGEFVGESNMIEGRVLDGAKSLVDSAVGHIAFGGGRAFATGQAVTAMIRPELIRLVGQPVSSNGARLTVTRTINFGDRVTVEGRCASGATLRLRLAGHEAAACVPGVEIEVGWLPGDVHILAAGA
jgi:putative spermidine/putrescine transport system ATP-binding protein